MILRTEASELWLSPSAENIHWSVDNFAIKESSLVCHGWTYVLGEVVDSVDLVATGMDGSIETISVQYGLHRPDVAAARNAPSSAVGFFYHGGVRTLRLKRLQLRIHVRKRAPFAGEPLWLFTVDLPGVSVPQSGGAALSSWRTRRDQAGRAVKMMAQGNWRDLWLAIRRRAVAQQTAKLSADEVVEHLMELQPNSVLIIDHSLGGGANQFRNSLVRERVRMGRDVVLWTFLPSILQFKICISRRDAKDLEYRVPWSAFGPLLARKEISEILFNNCVSFPQPERMAVALSTAISLRSVTLVMLVHDFHWVCPSHFLLDSSGHYCGVPEIAQCRKCLPDVKDQLASLFLARDVDQWRMIWGNLLLRATEVRCFSQSTVTLMRRAYPQLGEANITVIPHDVQALPGQFVRVPVLAERAIVCVAVVGSISFAKGGAVVKALALAIRQHRLPMRLVVIGELEGGAGDGDVTQTGSYDPGQLAELITNHGVHLALMPSVVAETFSFVTHELMQLKVPVVCFSLGAQAEAIAKYPLGKIIPLGCTPVALAHELLDFNAQLDGRWPVSE